MFARRVKVDVASHSAHMDPLMDELGRGLDGLRAEPARVPLRSTVTGEPVAGPELDRGYWVRNLREPVLFSRVVRALAEAGHDLFLEVSPHPVLVAALQQELDLLGGGRSALATLVRDEDESLAMRTALGGLYCRGLEIDWRRQGAGVGRVVPLPAYPWQRERHWHEPAGAGTAAAPTRGLLGPHLASSIAPGHFWQTEIGLERMPYLADHKVNGAVVFPAAAFSEMALAAAADLTGAEGLSLQDLRFEHALVLPATGGARVQVALTPGPGGSWLVRISSQAPDADVREWTLHARAVARAESSAFPTVETPSPAGVVPPDPHYAAMAARGLQYGPAFRSLQALAASDGDTAWGRVSLPEGVSATGHRVHPSVLDGALQLAVSVLPAHTAGRTWVPTGVRRLGWRRDGSLGGTIWARARLAGPGSAEGSFLADVLLADDAGQVLLEVDGLELTGLDEREDDRLASALYEPVWLPAPRTEASTRTAAAPGSWLLLPDRRGIAARLADELRRADHEVLLGEAEDVSDAARLAALLSSATAGGRLRGIVHLASLDAPSAETVGASALGPSQALTCDGPTRLVQTLAQLGPSPAPRLWLVSSGAQAVRPSETPAVEQAPLWGLGASPRASTPSCAARSWISRATRWRSSRWRTSWRRMATRTRSHSAGPTGSWRGCSRGARRRALRRGTAFPPATARSSP